MGWKRLKEHYRIGHLVHFGDQGVFISSEYAQPLIAVGLDGRISKRYGEDRWGKNEDLLRYQKEIDADPELCRRLLMEPDVFSQSLPVWTFNGGDIIEKQCEEYGWPNCTHDGKLMYANHYFRTPEEAKKRAIEEAESGLRFSMTQVKIESERLNNSATFMDRCRKDLNKLLGRDDYE